MKFNITLAQWKEIEAAYRSAWVELNKCTKLMTRLASEHFNDAKTVDLIMKMRDDIDEAAFHVSPQSVHPQSEWTGGDSDDPKNHTLREPNIVGLGAGHFPKEQLEEAGAKNHGPCDWEFRSNWRINQ
jgi:hypothetical protein